MLFEIMRLSFFFVNSFYLAAFHTAADVDQNMQACEAEAAKKHVINTAERTCLEVTTFGAHFSGKLLAALIGQIF